jgi:AmpD protein
VHSATGLLVGARQVLSPHCDARPSEAVTDLVILHGISLPPGDYGGPWIERLFTGNLPAQEHPYFATIAGMRVSAHLLVRRDGEVIQFVPFGARAWHAGVSSYDGRGACNDFSVGIELEGTDEGPYEEAQYERVAQLVAALCAAYPALSAQRVVGHSDVAPGRKTDPGEAFDWPRLRRLLNQHEVSGT